MPYELLLDEQGNAILKDGQPVYKFPDGSEKPVDVNGLYGTLTRANGEAKDRRLENEKLKEQLAVLEGIENPAEFVEKAKKAIETIENLEGNRLIEANKVDELKAQIAQTYEKKFADTRKQYDDMIAKSNATIEKKDLQIRQAIIQGAFDRSDFLRNKTTLASDIAFSFFGKNFRIEEQKDGTIGMKAFHSNGDPIYSVENPGSDPSFEEALAILVDSHPQKERFMRDPATGAGVDTAGGGGNKGAKHLPLKDWQEMYASAKPEEKARLMQQKRKGDIVIDIETKT